MSEDPLTEPPFAFSSQLNHSLDYCPRERTLRLVNSSNNLSGSRPNRLPGSPHVELSDTAGILKQTHVDVTTEDFNKFARKNRNKISFNSDPISSLTKNIVLGRQIVISEDVGLHCIWDDDRIFFKPIPYYLLSYGFWSWLLRADLESKEIGDYRNGQDESKEIKASPTHLEERENIITSACGLLRTYTHIIRYRSDFDIAARAGLVPIDATFEDLILFLEPFKDLPDSMISDRWCYGEIQLQTLNMVSFFTRLKPYHRLHRNRYNAFFLRYYGPTLFVFATFSVALSAMQVALAVRAGEAPTEGVTDGGLGGSWRSMGYAFRWFSLYSMIFAASMGLMLLVFLFGLISVDQWESYCRWRAGRKQRAHR
jgi:hypothetical protein